MIFIFIDSSFFPPPRSFLTEQVSQDVAEMLLVVQKEVDDDGTWLIADDTRK